MKNSSVKYWESYWQQGHLTSFGESFKHNYTGELKSIWLDFFNSASSGKTLLDIGTGAGALIEICLESETDFVQIIGIDSAKITPSNVIIKSTNAKIMSAVSAHSIPLKDNSIDYVISQFGIEYSVLSKSLPEIARLLVIDGHFQFVVHHADSSILQSNTSILTTANLLLQANGPLALLKVLVGKLKLHGKQNSRAETARNKFNKSIERLFAADEKGIFLTDFPKLMKTVLDEANFGVGESMIDSFRDELYGLRSRLRELSAAAFGLQRQKEFSQLCTLSGLFISSQTLISDDKGVLIACKISGFKTPI